MSRARHPFPEQYQLETVDVTLEFPYTKTDKMSLARQPHNEPPRLIPYPFTPSPSRPFTLSSPSLAFSSSIRWIANNTATRPQISQAGPM
jgi:hypothetical protein